jgi:PAS domain S-box-containing protein
MSHLPDSIRLSTLIAELMVGVLFEDKERRVLLANDMFCSMFEIPLSPSELVGLDCSEAADQAKGLFTNPDAFLQGIEQALSSQEPYSDELVLRDGRVLERSCKHIKADDTPEGLLWLYRDVTERSVLHHRIRQSEDRARAILRSTPDAIISIDTVGRIREFNPAAEALFGWKADEVLGLPLSEFIIPEGMRERHHEGMERMNSGGASRILGTPLNMIGTHREGHSVFLKMLIVRLPVEEQEPWYTAFISGAPGSSEAGG